MKLRIYKAQSDNVYFNIATEKVLFDTLNDDDVVIFLWSNDNTVVIGKNQNVFNEVNLTKLISGGGKVSRRFTGGGAVYHDVNNLNFTFIMKIERYDEGGQAEIILEALKSLGIIAEKNGRNDLTADGRKFSGSAYLKADGKGMHHGTLMIETDTARMSECLNVDKAKLASKGVESVKSRVVNLRELLPSLCKQQLAEALVKACENHYGAVAQSCSLTGEQVDKASNLAKYLSSEEWLIGKSVKGYEMKKKRFSWGGIEVLYRQREDKKAFSELFIYTDSLIPDGFGEVEKLAVGKSAEELASLPVVLSSSKENLQRCDVLAFLGEVLLEI